MLSCSSPFLLNCRILYPFYSIFHFSPLFSSLLPVSAHFTRLPEILSFEWSPQHFLSLRHSGDPPRPHPSKLRCSQKITWFQVPSSSSNELEEPTRLRTPSYSSGKLKFFGTLGEEGFFAHARKFRLFSELTGELISNSKWLASIIQTRNYFWVFERTRILSMIADIIWAMTQQICWRDQSQVCCIIITGFLNTIDLQLYTFMQE